MQSEFRGPCPFRRKDRDLFFGPAARILTFALICAAVSAGSGCRAVDRQTQTASAVTVEFTDGIGRKVHIPTRPGRIISLAPSITETLFIVGAGDQLIGVTRQCDWPAEVARKEKIGDLMNPNYEVIIGARPDLVIASTAGNDRGAVLKLAALGLPVYVTAPRTVEAIFETVRQIATITGHAAEGERVAADMRRRLDDVARRLESSPRTKAFFVTWFDPLLAPGRNTFETGVLRLAWVDSISANVDEFYPRFSLEQVLAEDPDAILTVRHSGKAMPDLRTVPGWQRLRAVRKGRVYLLDEVFQHPSPRFVDGVEQLARLLYPEHFR
jgi:iron complex transport system substrate-binding protein